MHVSHLCVQIQISAQDWSEAMFSVWHDVAPPDADHGLETLPSEIWNLFYFEGLHLMLMWNVQT